MTELRYDIVAVGENQLRAVIRGIEGEILGSNKRMTAQIRASGGGGGRRPRALVGGASAEQKAVARAAISEDAKVWREKERQAKRFAKIEIEAYAKVDRERVAGIKREQAAREKLATSMSRGVATSVVRSVGGVVRAGGQVASVVGGLAIASALHDQMQVQAGASRVANQGGRPDLKGQLATQAQTIAGFTGEQSLGALDQFVQKSGDLKAGMAAWQMMGKVALATSSDITEVGEAAGAAFNAIAQDTKDPVEQLRILEDVMKTLATQGNMGSVEMRDFAVELPKLAAAARRFGGDSGSSLKMMGALTQLAVKRGGATDAAEAGTSVMRFTDDLIKDGKAKKGRPGLNVFTDSTNTKLRDPGEIIGDIMSSTHGDLTKIGTMFGQRGMRALSGVSGTYMDAYNGAEKTQKGSGDAAGRAAILAALKEFTGAGSEGFDEKVKSRMADPDIQLTEAVKAFNVAIGTELMPALTKLLPQFTALAPAAKEVTESLVTFVQYLSQNPFEGVGALIAAKITADLGQAALGEVAKKAIATQLGMAGGVVVTTAIVTVTVLEMMMADSVLSANKKLNTMDAADAAVRASARKELDETGKLSPQTRAQLESVQKQEERRLTGKEFNDPLKHMDTGRVLLNNFSGGLTGPTVFDEGSVTSSADNKRQGQNMDSFTETVRLLAEATDRQNKATDALAEATGNFRRGTSDPPSPTRTHPIVGR